MMLHKRIKVKGTSLESSKEIEICEKNETSLKKKIVEVEERENEYYSLKKVEEMQGIKATNWVTG